MKNVYKNWHEVDTLVNNVWHTCQYFESEYRHSRHEKHSRAPLQANNMNTFHSIKSEFPPCSLWEIYLWWINEGKPLGMYLFACLYYFMFFPFITSISTSTTCQKLCNKDVRILLCFPERCKYTTVVLC